MVTGKTEYIIISSGCLGDVQRKVNNYLAMGWELHGVLLTVPMQNSVKGWPNWVEYTQAMVKLQM